MISNQDKITLRSRIKHTFGEELLQLIANICDTKRIDSSQRKMKMLQQLLKRYKIRFDVLGGATNRLALYIDGYAFKFAMDRQGYKDNLMEYALSPELQPYVTRMYETNGYILVAEPVKTMTPDDFQLRKMDILRILETLSSDYLLGDVGYLKKNFTNWGIRDDGSVVILDFAYCHRGTEKLFTCQVCGDGMLVYDSTFSYLRCSNSTVCMTKYTYNEIKMIQGDQVDIDMINEAKNHSIVIGHGETTKHLYADDGRYVDGTKPVIKTFDDYIKYIKDVKYMFATNFNQNEAVDLMIDRMKAKTPKEIADIDAKLVELVGETDSTDPVNNDNGEEFITLDDLNIVDDEPDEVNGQPADIDIAPTVDEMVDIVRGDKPNTITTTTPDTNNQQDDEYYEEPEVDPLDAQIALIRQRRRNSGPRGSVSGSGEEFTMHYPTTKRIGVDD